MSSSSILSAPSRTLPPRPRTGGRRLAIAALATAVAAALGISFVRDAIIDLRYELADRVRQIEALEESLQAETIRVQRLRDPKRLRALAAERGFGFPARVVDLPPLPEPAEASARRRGPR